MNKNILPGMSPTYENMARSVVQAQKKINGLNTSPTGTISVHRSNGTKDIYGVLNKDGYSVAKNVGDTVAPPKPKGIFATSSADVVYVAWDGTLEDKIPSDFYNVTIYMGVGGQSSVMGTLTEPGIVSTPPLPTAQSVEIWATAEDDTCKEDGTPAHNVSPESTHQSVAIEHGSNSQGVEELKKLIEKRVDAIEAKAEQAVETADNTQKVVEELNNSFSHDSEGAHVGSKTGIHTTIDRQGMKLLNGKTQMASFDAGMVTLGGTALNIVAGYNNGRDDTRSTLLTCADLLLRPTVGVGVEAKAMSTRLSSDDRMNTTAIGANVDGLSIETNINEQAAKISKADITFNDLVKLLKFTPWITLQDDGVCRIRYSLRGGMMYLDVYLAAGYSTYTTQKQLPDNLLPAIVGYYPLGTQQGNNTAKMWLGAAGGGDGHIYVYNYDSGYCSGIVPVIPKSLE